MTSRNFFISRNSRIWLTVLCLYTILYLQGCQKEQETTQETNEHLAVHFAQKYLTKDAYRSIAWQNIRTLKNRNETVGWVAYPKNPDKDALSAYLIIAQKGKPIEIVSHWLSSKQAIAKGSGSVDYKRRAFVSGEEKDEILDLSKTNEKNENNGDSKKISRLSLSHPCECCGTLPCVIFYGKRKQKKIFINGPKWNGGYPEEVYLPIWDMGGGGGGGTGGTDGGNNGSGTGSGENENQNIIDLRLLQDYKILQNTLYTPDDYPGKDLGWPWRWWETLSDQEKEAIEKVKEEFRDEPPATSSCKGTNRFAGRSSHSGTAEHTIIQFDYMGRHPLTAEREYSIPNSSLNGNTGYADLVNKLTREIFEIKPQDNAIERANGLSEVERYVEKACLHCGGGFIKGQNYPETIMPYPGRPDKNMRVRLNQDGLITYQEVPKNQVSVPVPVPESVSQKLKDFFNELIIFEEISEEMIVYWLNRNPEVKNYLIAAGVGLVIATIIEDFATLGAGISDDIPSILLAMKLIRLARTIP